MKIKTRGSHLTCKVANKCLNVHEQAEVVGKSKRWSPPFLCSPVNRQYLRKKTVIQKDKKWCRVTKRVKTKQKMLKGSKKNGERK